jgi:hypothetical protein
MTGKIPEIVEVRPLGGHRLFLRFADGVCGELDFSASMTFEGVFADLRQPEVFAQARVNPDVGTIEWPTGADQDPLVLYARVTGKKMLESA